MISINIVKDFRINEPITVPDYYIHNNIFQSVHRVFRNINDSFNHYAGCHFIKYSSKDLTKLLKNHNNYVTEDLQLFEIK
jgi:hypothetical protein